MKITTHAEALRAVQDNYWSLRSIPKKFKTPKVCGAAVRKSGRVLEWVPKELRNRKLCWAAMRTYRGAIEFVPRKFKTPKLCKLAVQRFPINLKWVPKEFWTPEMYKNSMASAWYPEEIAYLRKNRDLFFIKDKKTK